MQRRQEDRGPREFFEFNTKLPIMAMLASKDLQQQNVTSIGAQTADHWIMSLVLINSPSLACAS